MRVVRLGSVLATVYASKCSCLQVLRALNALLRNDINNDAFQRLIFCEPSQRVREHLCAHVDTMAPHGFTAAALGLLAARDVRVLLREPTGWPSSSRCCARSSRPTEMR